MNKSNKVCPSCKRIYDSRFMFCTTCGCGLKEKKNNGLVYLILGTVVVVSIFGIGKSINEQKKVDNNIQAINEYKRDKKVEKYLNTPSENDLKINDDWESFVSGNYVRIKGTVTNRSSSKTISYYEIEAKFYNDNNRVMDSEWTNGTDLGPGESQSFEIMHRHSEDEKDIKISVKSVS